MKQTLALMLALIVGCVAGTTASQMIAPPARAGGPVPTWEYFCYEADNSDVTFLNRLGTDGWELVSVVGSKAINGDAWYRYCMKRPH